MKKIILTSDLHSGFSYRTHDILDKFYASVQKENADYLVIAGDIISHSQSQWDPTLVQLRDHFDIPILVVLGNHDVWQDGHNKSLWSTRKKIFDKFEKYDITYLPDNPVVEDDFRIYGFDGWYKSSNPPSKDKYYLSTLTEGINTHDYIRKRWGKDQLSIIPKKDRHQIVVTHFDFTDHPMSADSGWLNEINTKADVLCVGHSHIQRFDEIMDMQIINTGSDYDDPKYVRLWGGFR